jgi:ABC-type Zn2+ transport system substrate-binding protein/surface adhesin
MKFRIDKLPKNEKDMEEIVKEVEEEHGHEHHHHHEHEHDIIDEIFVSLQSLEGKVNQLSNDAEYCRREIKRIYLSMSKLLKAVFAKDDASRLQALTELKEVLEKEMTA